MTRTLKLGTGPDAPWMTAPDVTDDLDRWFPLVGVAWEESGNVRAGKIGEADAKLTDYDALVAFASNWIGARNIADGVPPMKV